MVPPVYTGSSSIEGTGCYAGRDIRKGELIGEYTGPRISEEEADEKYSGTEATYLFMLDDGQVIDATDDDNPMKYINHCCSPNCEAYEEDGRILIYAAEDIKEGEELHYDYQLAADEDDDGLSCVCGAPNCRGTMRGDHA
jgi:SET domain-containing protein